MQRGLPFHHTFDVLGNVWVEWGAGRRNACGHSISGAVGIECRILCPVLYKVKHLSSKDWPTRPRLVACRFAYLVAIRAQIHAAADKKGEPRKIRPSHNRPTAHSSERLKNRPRRRRQLVGLRLRECITRQRRDLIEKRIQASPGILHIARGERFERGVELRQQGVFDSAMIA
jgi:hypothetical protein